ncbi:hypothetical protein BJV82DRAFT_582893 [Fennellomyces sp. T-0311]|nr:hypothetical protein BJV82DRAFT_582893 [Fennellomyces sp. T-0311]
MGQDKPPQASKNVVQETLEKNRRLRVMSLNALCKKLVYPTLIEEFTPLTALWHGNMLNHQILVTIQRYLMDINMNDGSRSPMHLNEQDDSIELQQSDAVAAFDELKKEEDEHVKYYKGAISSLEFSDDGSIILTAELPEYFKDAKLHK